MTTLMEIEEAVEKLARSQQEKLYRRLIERLGSRPQVRRSLPLVPAIGRKITQEHIDNAVDAE